MRAMKTFIPNLFLVCCLSILLACEEDISSVRTADGLATTYPEREITLKVDYFILKFDLSGKEDGKYLAGRNPDTGSEVNILIREKKVVGFQIFRKDGSLVQPHGTSQGPGTPDHSKKPQIICQDGVEIFYDPEYGYIFKQYGDCDPTSPIIEIIIDTRY